MIRKYPVILLFGLFFSSVCIGQVPFFQQYFLLRKNESVKINAICQDKAGFIWLGTNSGLFKFDGINKQRFTLNDSLPDEHITALCEDSSGRLWIGCKNGALAFLENDKVKKYETQEGDATAEISDLLFDRKGNLWFSTLGDGLYYIADNRMYRLDENDKMPDLFVYSITLDPRGNIWAGTDGGIAICTLQQAGVSIRVLNYENGLPDNIIRKIVMEKDGSAWIATEEAGIVRYHFATNQFTPLKNEKWSYGSVTDFLLTGNEIWISSAQSGMLIMNRKSGSIRTLDSKQREGLAGVNALLQDQEGNIWIGSANGVIRTPGDDIEYIENLEPSHDANVMALAVDREGNTWFSTKEGLFKRSVDSRGKTNTSRPLAGTVYRNYPVVSLFVDKEGSVWAGFYGEGAIRINPVTGKISYLKKELVNGNVLHISGRGNVVWLATLGGCARVDISAEALRVKNYSMGNGLISDYIYQVFPDSKGRQWFATDGKGIDMLDENGFHHYKAGIQSNVVYGFTEDGDHRIWANVQGEGLYRFDDEKTRSFRPGPALRNNNISSLTTDLSGNLVLMHDLGIEIYDIRKKSTFALGDEFGIQDKKPNLNAVAKYGQDGIYFGTDHGIIIYSEKFNSQRAVPRPHLEGLKVANRNVGISPDLSFRYNENDIMINYLGFWYEDPDNLNFRYKLDHFDKNWLESRNRSVTYSSLPPGDYTFQLQASVLPDFKDAKTTSFRFRITPPFWRTPLFYVLSFLLILVGVYAFIKYRERKLEEDKKILQEKNAELSKTNMELDKFVYSVSHDLRAPLSSMLGIVEISTEETEDALQLKHLGILKSNIKKLDGFIQDILDYSRNSRLEVDQEEINFKDMLEEITNNLKYASPYGHPLELKMEFQAEAPFRSDKKRLGIVLNNVISNAIRYQKPQSENPWVAIHVVTTPEAADITVQDNGIGIPKDDQHKIFDMFYRVSENSVGSGLGLYIVKETVARLDGQIHVESESGTGTSFSIRIPNKV